MRQAHESDVVKQMRAWQQAHTAAVQPQQGPLQAGIYASSPFATGTAQAALTAQTAEREKTAALDAAFAELQNELGGSASPALLSGVAHQPAVLSRGATVSSPVIYQQPASASTASSTPIAGSATSAAKKAQSSNAKPTPEPSPNVLTAAQRQDPLRPAGPGKVPVQQTNKDKREQEKRSYTGQVTRKLHGFGFIHCDRLKRESGTDVYCSGHFLTNFEVGDWVDFEIQRTALKDGDQKPRALSVRASTVVVEPPEKKFKVPEGTFYKF